MGFIRNYSVLARSGVHRDALDALEYALARVHPSNAIPRMVSVRDGCVAVRGAGVYCPRDGVYVAGFGKASRSMAEALLSVLDGLVEAGVVIAPRGMEGRVGPVEVLAGDHPVPREDTLRASLRLLEFLQSLPRGSLLILLVSGGGSSLFEVPLQGLELEDIAYTTRQLLEAGADIYEVNTVRKHLSAVKGGRLLRYIASEHVVTLAMSDVPGDNPSFIASGPTVADPTTYTDALRVLERYGLLDSVPVRVRRLLEDGASGRVEETVKPGDPILARNRTVIVARNLDAVKAASELLAGRGYRVLPLTDTLRGEAREAGKVLASLTEALARRLTPYNALVAGGETTVTVRGGGVGGRNQELCLSLAVEAYRLRIVERYVAACMGTDGVDGVSPAAGAVVDGDTVPEALDGGLNPVSYLDNNDSYSFFSKLGRAIDTGGYTGVNVNDITVILTPRNNRG